MNFGVTYYVIKGPSSVISSYSGKNNGLYMKESQAQAYLNSKIKEAKSNAVNAQTLYDTMRRTQDVLDNRDQWLARAKDYEDNYRVVPVQIFEINAAGVPI